MSDIKVDSGVRPKIGILDSGAGGLTVLAALIKSNKAYDYYYFADDAFAPYGSLSIDKIQQRVLSICDFLIDKGVTSLVIACNTATLEVIHLVRSCPKVIEKNILIVGIEPAIKPASLLDYQGVVCVLATPITCHSNRLQALINHASLDRVSQSSRYHCIASEVLANAIDALPGSGSRVDLELQRIRAIMAELDSRVLVLACTHYPLIKSMFEGLFDYPVQILEPSDAVARRVIDCLPSMHLGGHESLSVSLYSSGDNQMESRLCAWLVVLLGESLYQRLSLAGESHLTLD